MTMMMQALNSRKVRQLVRDRPLFATRPDATVAEAAIEMRARNVGALAVMQGDRLVGIISERDVVQRCVGKGDAPTTTRVEQVMTKEVITIDRGMSMSVATLMMIENGIRHLPVMAHNRVLGMISIRQLVEEYRKGIASAVPSLF